QNFDFRRAGRWMDDHVIFTFQAVLLYLVTIFSLKYWMKDREPLKLRIPVATWNFSIALLSGVCAWATTPDFLDILFNKGFSASLCSGRDRLFSGASGRAIFVLLFARLPEFIDTLFIVLRKQPLLFIHYYHHAFTLCFAWFTYSGAWPSSVHGIYVNSLIHTAMYSYYFLTTLNIRPPPIVAKSITIAQILQFAYLLYALIHFTVITQIFGVPCESDSTALALAWIMDLSYLYLFVDFYVNKYNGRTTLSIRIKKTD
ncbi:hypothetical protein PMAYCL1PPCAC_31506, partial [Pristionchus mayeri]